MNETIELLSLLSIQQITEKKLHMLLERFGSPGNILGASRAELKNLLDRSTAQRIASFSRTNDVKEHFKTLKRLSARLIPYYSDDYPTWLKNTEHFPPIIFVRGRIIDEDELSVAVIGTRGASVYGKEIARRFAGDFARAGVTVISGMARGVDTVAHEGAIHGNGRTIAVMGCGIDICYPPENRNLMNAIIQHGAVVSEYNIGTPPLAHNFPKRNRIVSGLALAVIAIEAKERSGVMNTVKWALEQNKHVFAVPGNIFSRTSVGTNKLIKDGAIPVTSADEVMEYLGIKYVQKERQTEQILIDEEERAVWRALSLEPICLDELAERISQPTSAILNTLLKLEIKGYVKQLPGMNFIKNLDKAD